MKAMIFAAGKGERMLPLTANTPKPLLKIDNKALIEYTIEQLVSAGFTELIINVAYLGQQIMNAMGNGQQFGANIIYSNEGNDPLETAGGIIQALPLLGNQPFLAVSADIFCEFPYQNLRHFSLQSLAHLVMVKNPIHHPMGDFHLQQNGELTLALHNRYTFSGIGVYQPALFQGLAAGKRKLVTVLHQAIAQHQVYGDIYHGYWQDIGTIERLQQANDFLLKNKCD